MSYYHRIIEQELSKMLGNFPAVMILGPRQVGKSTLLEYLSRKNKIQCDYVTLDDPVLAGQANERPEQFLGTYNRPLVIDEFQYASSLTSYIKMEIDKARKDAMFGGEPDVGTIFYLTGSQVFNMMDTVRESLAGRVGIINLYGLSAREIERLPGAVFTPVFSDIRKHKPSKHLSERELYERILRGGYPELYLKPELDSRQYFSSYLRTYIERDIRKQLRPENEYNFTRFVSLLAARTGQQLIVENVAAEIGIDGRTAMHWLSLLESTGLVYLLRPYFNNATKRVSKKPKIYFTDTGLACDLAGYPTVEGLINSAYKGQIFETYVVMEILKSFTNAGIDVGKDLYYYRRNDKQESDLLFRLRDVYYPIEIKSADHVTSGDVVWFNDLKNLGIKVGDGLVLCRASSLMTVSENSYAVPIEYI